MNGTEVALVPFSAPLDPAFACDHAFAWTGVPGTFQGNGFVEVARRSPTRPIMRVFRPAGSKRVSK